LNKQKIVVIIPAFNEAETILSVINEIHSLGFAVIIVDDGSKDNTLKIAKETMAITFSHNYNKGYESALNTGIKLSIEKGFDFAITFDADGQFFTDDLIKCIDYQSRKNADIIVGIRNYKNRFSEYLLVHFGKFRFGLNDPLCGMKLYRLDLAKKFLPFDSFQLVGMEMAFKMIDDGCKCFQLPIQIKKRKNTSRYGSSFSGEKAIIIAFLRVIKVFGIFKK
jgi:glycosyltransferase involved in cell wall biosynthesis